MSGRTDLVPVETVLLVEEPEEIQMAMEENVARWDDAYWASRLRLPFTWPRFLEWWVARRWVAPRKEH